MTTLQRTAGNRAVGRLLQRRTDKKPKRDEFDDFLDKRLELFHLEVAGADWHVTLSDKEGWAADYTPRVLALAAMSAAIRTVFGGDVELDAIRETHDRLVGKSIRYDPGGNGRSLVIEDGAMESMREALGLSWSHAGAKWRERIMLARLLDRALRLIRDGWHELRDLLPEKELAEHDLSANAIFRMLDDRRERSIMVELAKHHAAGLPLVLVFNRDAALRHGTREPGPADFAHLTRRQWATIAAGLAIRAQQAWEAYKERRDEELRRKQLEAFLNPHPVDVDHAAAFIVKNYDPARSVHVSALGGVDVSGGMRFTITRGEKVFVLRADKWEVIYHNESDGGFYRQSVPGFGEALTSGLFTEVSEQIKHIIPITTATLAVIKALFPPLGKYLLAHQVINFAARVAEHQDEFEDVYASLRISWESIDEIVPGLLGSIKDAVLDVKTLAIVDFDERGWAKWLEFALSSARRIVMARKAAPGAAAGGVIRRAFRIFFKTLKEIGTTVAGVLPALWASKDIDPLEAVDRARDVLEEKLRAFGVVDAMILATFIASLSREDLERLVREVEDAVEHGMELWRLLDYAFSAFSMTPK